MKTKTLSTLGLITVLSVGGINLIAKADTSLIRKEIKNVPTGEIQQKVSFKNLTTGKIETFLTTNEEMRKITKEDYQPKKSGYEFYSASGGVVVTRKETPVINNGEYYISNKVGQFETIIKKENGILSTTTINASTTPL